LKQKQFNPLPFEQQVCLLFAGTNGFLDPILPTEVEKFEVEYLKHMKEANGDLLELIKKEGQVTDEIKDRLRRVLTSFMDQGLFKLKA